MDLLWSQARIWIWVWDILVLGTLGPWDPWTLEPLDLGTLGPLPSANSGNNLTFILIPWDLLLPSAFSSSNLLPPPSHSSQLLLPPPKPPPNSSYPLLKGLRWLISSYMKRFQCYSAQKSFMVVVGGDIAIIATSSRSRSLRDLR